MRTYGEIKYVPPNEHAKFGLFGLHLEAQVSLRFKRIFERVDKTPAQWLKLVATPENARELEWFFQRYPVEMSPNVAHKIDELARGYDRRIALISTMLAPDYAAPTVELALPAREYQLLPAEMCMQTGSLLLLDEVGLGKTVQSIVLMAKPGTLPAIVVTVTGSMPAQFEREIHRFAPALKTHILTRAEPFHDGKESEPQCLAARMAGIPPRLPGRSKAKRYDPNWTFEMPDVVILPYSKLTGWAEWLVENIRPKTVVYDEVQEARHGDSTLRGRSMQYLAQKTEYRMGLSATPIHNGGVEIHAVMETLAPGVLGDYSEWYREWCKDQMIVDSKAFGMYLRERGLALSRTKADVGRELPPVTISEQFCECDPAVIDAMKKDSRAVELAKFVLSKRRESFQASGQFDMFMRQQTGIAKAPYVAAFVNMLLESGEPVVLFGWHHAVYGIWRELLKEHNPVFYTGKETDKQKLEAVDAFRTGKTKLFIISLRSGRGIDGLQYSGCSNVVFGELDWSPAVHEQGLGRVARDGIDRSVTGWFMVSDEGSDPNMAEVLGVKRGQLEGIRDPEGNLVLAKLDPDAIKKLAHDFLRKHGFSTELEPGAPLPAGLTPAWQTRAREAEEHIDSLGLFALLEG